MEILIIAGLIALFEISAVRWASDSRDHRGTTS